MRLELDRKVRVEGGVFSTTALSQGQRKRLALLVAFMEDRPIYVFDEWAADQDPHYREIFYRELLPELRARARPSSSSATTTATTASPTASSGSTTARSRADLRAPAGLEGLERGLEHLAASIPGVVLPHQPVGPIRQPLRERRLP